MVTALGPILPIIHAPSSFDTTLTKSFTLVDRFPQTTTPATPRCVRPLAEPCDPASQNTIYSSLAAKLGDRAIRVVPEMLAKPGTGTGTGNSGGTSASSGSANGTNGASGADGADNFGPTGIKYGTLIRLKHGGVAAYTSQGWAQIGLNMGSHLDAISMYYKNGGSPAPGQTNKELMPHLMPLFYVPVPGYTPFTTGSHFLDFTRYPYFHPLFEQVGFTFCMPTPAEAVKAQDFLKESYQGRNPQMLTDSARDEHDPNEEGIPDLGAETQKFVKTPSEDFAKVRSFQNNETQIGDGSVTIKHCPDKGPMVYQIFDRGSLLKTINLASPAFDLPKEDLNVDPKTMMDPKFQEIRERVLIKGESALLPISTADYFSGEGTSGMMLWKDRKVTLIDPPAHTVAYLIKNGIPLSAIEGIIITHGHTDHFTPAAIELMYLCPKLNFYGTKTMYNLLQESYNLSIAINGGMPEGLTQMNFVQLNPRKHTQVRGMSIRTHYTCHSVAAVAIEVWTKPPEEGGELAMYLSGDTIAEEAELDRLFPDMHTARKAEIMRYQHLLESTWEQENPPIILIEAGVKGLHTQPEVTLTWLKEFAKRKDVSLETVLERVRFYHVSDARAKKAGVPKLKAGHHGFISLSDHFPTQENDIERNLSFINSSPFLASLSDDNKLLLAQNAQLNKLEQGALLLTEGEPTKDATYADNQVHIIVSGGFQLYAGTEAITHVPFGIIGEGALFGEDRNATAIASMTSHVLSFSAEVLAQALGDDINTIRQVRDLRSKHYNLLKESFPQISDQVLTPLLMIAKEETITAGKRFIEEGDHTEKDVYLIMDGQARIWTYPDNKAGIPLTAGDVVGEMAVVNQKARSANVTATSDMTVLRLPYDKLIKLMEDYPIIRTYLQRLAHQRKMDEARMSAA